MKTRKLSALFPVILTICFMVSLCNSVIFAADVRVSPKTISNLRLSQDTNSKILATQNTFIDTQIIRSQDENGKIIGEICLKQDLETKCFVEIKCETGEPDEEGVISIEELLKRFPNVKYIEVPESTCNSFTIDVEGNTRYYCSRGRCYPY